ncbi:LysR family transcriptional regulator, partial [Serratia marcescens]
GLSPLAPELLPVLGQLGVVLHRAEDQPSAAVQRLAQIVVERIET